MEQIEKYIDDINNTLKGKNSVKMNDYFRLLQQYSNKILTESDEILKGIKAENFECTHAQLIM